MAISRRPYGTWSSPLSAGDVAGGVRLSDVQWDGSGRRLVWLEQRGGRGVLVCQDVSGGGFRELNSLEVKAGVGYGGGDFSVHGKEVYFVSDGRIHRQPLERGLPRPLTPKWGKAASPAVSPDGRWLAYVHSHQEVDVLAAADSSGECWPWKLTEGRDFYMQPAWHPNGKRLAWIAWDHPNMPWDGTGLYLAQVEADDGRARLKDEQLLKGSPNGSRALSQPSFSPGGGKLLYLSDETGWACPWLLDLESGQSEPLADEKADFGPPSWVQGVRTCAFSADGRHIYLVRQKAGFHSLVRLDLGSRELEPVAAAEAETAISQIATGAGGGLAWIGSSAADPVRVKAIAEQKVAIWRRSRPESLPREYHSRPRQLEIPLGGQEPQAPALTHALYYPPAHPEFEGEGPPPAILNFHGGPTSAAEAEYDPKAQFFTTRGFAFVELNYRGSTGYGRAYWEALKGRWGELEVEDADAAAAHLIREGLAGQGRIALSGGSAGGYSALLALARFPGRFRAAVCRYPVTDLFALAEDTHKFERCYADTLVGRLPEAAAAYQERSPVAQAERIKTPVAIFQGRDDEVVPPSQAQAIADELEKRGVECSLTFYEGEGHGFRKPETLKDYHRRSLAFLRRHLVYGPPQPS